MNKNSRFDQLQQLLNLSQEILEFAPWEFLEATEYFCIEFPHGDENLYVQVIGQAGENRALVFYRGEEAYHTMFEMNAGRMNRDDFVMQNNSLNVSFDPKRDIPPAQKKMLAKFKIPGLKKLYPSFTSFFPGKTPNFFLDDYEVNILIQALQCALPLLMECEVGEISLYRHGSFEMIHVDSVTRKVEWKVIPSLPKKPSAELIPFASQKIKVANYPTKSRWELHIGFAGGYVKESEEDLALAVALFVEAGSGFVLGMSLDTLEALERKVSELFLELIEKYKYIPKNLNVAQSNAFDWLQPICEQISLPLHMQEKTPFAKEAYDSMRKEIDKNFSAPQRAVTAKPEKTTYQLMVTVENTNVWRQILVPSDISLASLHLVLQFSIGWLNSHLHDFSLGSLRFTDPEFMEDSFDDEKFVDEYEVRLSELLQEEGNLLHYTYDYGDSWEHEIRLEKIIPGKAVQPKCLGGGFSCPPEDCGGSFGYAEIIEAWNNVEHDEYKQFRDWLGSDWSPDRFEVWMNPLLKKIPKTLRMNGGEKFRNLITKKVDKMFRKTHPHYFGGRAEDSPF